MSDIVDEIECPDCGGCGEVQCVNLGQDGQDRILPCPTCIAAENGECRAKDADTITRLTAEVERLRSALETIAFCAYAEYPNSMGQCVEIAGAAIEWKRRHQPVPIAKDKPRAAAITQPTQETHNDKA